MESSIISFVKGEKGFDVPVINTERLKNNPDLQDYWRAEQKFQDFIEELKKKFDASEKPLWKKMMLDLLKPL